MQPSKIPSMRCVVKPYSIRKWHISKAFEPAPTSAALSVCAQSAVLMTVAATSTSFPLPPTISFSALRQAIPPLHVNMSYSMPPSATDLAYPWISQFDDSYQTFFYVNTETGETSWQHPGSGITQQSGDLYQSSYDGYGSPSYQATPATTSYPSSGAGEAASFYSSSSAPVNGGSSHQTTQAPIPDAVEGGEPGERGLGKVVVMGGMLYMAHKLYKDWQKNKLNSHQQSLLKPPQFAPLQQPPPAAYGQQYAAKAQAFDPQQVYSQPAIQQSWQSSPLPSPRQYGQAQPSYAPQPPSYGTAPYTGSISSSYDVSPSIVHAFRYLIPGSPQNNSIPPPSFNGQPVDYQSGRSYDSLNGGYDSGSAYSSAPAPGGWQPPPTHSGWGDPRY